MNLIIRDKLIEVDAPKSGVLMPSEILKAREHLGRAQGTGNAKGTVAPKAPTGGKKGKVPKGAPIPESSKEGGSNKEISKRGGHKAPYSSYGTKVSGMGSSAAQNYLKLRNTETGKIKWVNISAGTANKAKFNNRGNLISVTIDGNKYPCANHLVTLPQATYAYAGLRSGPQGADKVSKKSGTP
jgi:hypothetical protein